MSIRTHAFPGKSLSDKKNVCCGIFGSNKRVKREWTRLVMRLFFFLFFPIMTFVFAIIFDSVDAVNPQQLYFSIPVTIFVTFYSIWTTYIFVDMCFVLFSKRYMYSKSNSENPMKKKINLYSLFEVTFLMFWCIIVWGYAIYLIDNSQFKDTLVSRTASLVDAGDSHFKIIGIFMYYTPLSAYGVGFAEYFPVGAAAKALTAIGIILKDTVFLIVGGTIIAIEVDRKIKYNKRKR